MVKIPEEIKMIKQIKKFIFENNLVLYQKWNQQIKKFPY